MIEIVDVEHGFCAVIWSPSGRLMLVDCGHNSTTGWRPSSWIASRGLTVDNLTITNVDEDHVSDLPRLRPYVQTFKTNWHLTPQWIARAKREFGIGPGVRSLVDMMSTSPGDAAPIDWGMQIERFCHSPLQFDDENALSLVTFIRHAGIGIVFPGDLTRQGWLAFLRDPGFIRCLQQTNIFVASHHGREDGYCPEIFRDGLCRPSLVIVSDKSVMHETQDVDYSRHALGIRWNQTALRRVLSTRKDGTLTITPSGTHGFHVQAHGS